MSFVVLSLSTIKYRHVLTVKTGLFFFFTSVTDLILTMNENNLSKINILTSRYLFLGSKTLEKMVLLLKESEGDGIIAIRL